VLNELAGLGGTDPVVLCAGSRPGPGPEPGNMRRTTLAALLPDAFGPASLG
jgi:cytidine deaminase